MTIRDWLRQNGYAREVDMLEAREKAWRTTVGAARREADRAFAELWARRFHDAIERMGLDVAMAAALRKR